jgi:hypothetical protein
VGGNIVNHGKNLPSSGQALPTWAAGDVAAAADLIAPGTQVTARANAANRMNPKEVESTVAMARVV